MAKTKPATIGNMSYRVLEKVPKPARGWAADVLRDFLALEEKVVALDFENKSKAIAKQTALNKLLKNEESEFFGAVKVSRQDATIYLELAE